MAMPATLIYTPAEYLAIERAAAHRSEYLDGRIVAMSGGSRNHSLIAAQLIRLIGNEIDGRPCEVHGSDLRVKVTDQGLYTYPDVTVICGEPGFEDAHREAIWSPGAWRSRSAAAPAPLSRSYAKTRRCGKEPFLAEIVSITMFIGPPVAQSGRSTSSWSTATMLGDDTRAG